MAKTVKGFFSNVKKGWDIVTYVSPEEKERRRIEYEKWCEEERAKRAAEAEREQAAERYAKDVKLVYDALIAQGFEDSEALELAKGVRITDEED